jgi:hypothetical protein
MDMPFPVREYPLDNDTSPAMISGDGSIRCFRISKRDHCWRDTILQAVTSLRSQYLLMVVSDAPSYRRSSMSSEKKGFERRHLTGIDGSLRWYQRRPYVQIILLPVRC